MFSELPVEPLAGYHRITVADAFGEAGQTYGGSSTVRGFPADTLLISDIMLAVANVQGSWQRGDRRLTPLPPAKVRQGERFDFFYEIYGLKPGARYVTELTIRRTSNERGWNPLRSILGTKHQITLRFREEAPQDAAAAVRQLRQLGTGLTAGDYAIRVKVTDVESGRSAISERMFGLLPQKDVRE